jgi:hypothetical protein
MNLKRTPVNESLHRMRKKPRPGELFVCAGHGTELTGCKSPNQVFAEPKVRRRARASSRGVLYKSGVYARKVLSLTPGGLPCAEMAEARAIDPDRMGEVSRRQIRRSDTDSRQC